ncbi:MAG: DNA alkylation repair protein [Bacteroidales bacterium]|nr:DNA alkylation repair protein [Bacteroidales bacterium]
MSLLYDSIIALRDDSQVEGLSYFFKTGPGQYGEGDVFLGIRVPRTREVVKRVWRDCSFDDIGECIISPYHEMRLAALLTLVEIFHHAKKDIELQQRCVDYYLNHTLYINNWDLVDLSCYEILGNWLLDKDRQVLYELARHGKTMWEQRIAMVSCMTFVRHNQFDDCLAISDILLYHKEDLIHKAVGWLLREVGKHHEPTLVDYLSSRYRAMPRTTLRYAIEKFPPDIRKAYLNGTR